MSFGMIMKNQISWKCEIVLYGYRHCIHKNRYYKDVAEDVGTKFDTSSYELDRPLPKTKKKVIGLIKDELGGKNMTNLLN